jgi:hypothetical protein
MHATIHSRACRYHHPPPLSFDRSERMKEEGENEGQNEREFSS